MSHLITRRELWHLNRHSVANGLAIGVFCAFLPIPGQTLVAAIMAIAMRANMPLSVAAVWISNPLTFGPMFYATYRLGAWLIGSDLTLPSSESSWFLYFTSVGEFWLPLLLGSLICGGVFAVISAVVVRLLWRMDTARRWRARRAQRRAQQSSNAN